MWHSLWRGIYENVGFANMIFQMEICASPLDFLTDPKSSLKESEKIMISMKVVMNFKNHKNDNYISV